jgi:serine/threonine protein kinase HipA of HipAB toxin-antitoxin module
LDHADIVVQTIDESDRYVFYGAATSLADGQIVEVITTDFDLPSGFYKINVSELAPLNVYESNPKYSDMLKRMGGVPTGDYEICMSTVDSTCGRMMGFQRVFAKIQNLM